MKKDGLAPNHVLYRTLFREMGYLRINNTENPAMMRAIRNIWEEFQDLMQTSFVLQQRGDVNMKDSESDGTLDRSTAAAYKRSEKVAAKELAAEPEYAISIYGRYVTMLYFAGQIEEAAHIEEEARSTFQRYDDYCRSHNLGMHNESVASIVKNSSSESTEHKEYLSQPTPRWSPNDSLEHRWLKRGVSDGKQQLALSRTDMREMFLDDRESDANRRTQGTRQKVRDHA